MYLVKDYLLTLPVSLHNITPLAVTVPIQVCVPDVFSDE